MMHALANDREVIITSDDPALADRGGIGAVAALSPWAAMGLARELIAAALGAATRWTLCECGTPMVFARTQAEKSMPVEAGDHPMGNMAASWAGGMLRVRALTQADPGLREGEHRVMPHHATCPSAGKYRRQAHKRPSQPVGTPPG